MTLLNIAVAGSTGRMGRTIMETIADAQDLRLSAALEQPDSPYLSQDAGGLTGTPCGVIINSDYASALTGSDVLIDFTRPAGTLTHLAVCRQSGIHMVIGTTGFSAEEKEIIHDAAKDIAIVFAPNMSVGVNILFRLLEVAAKALPAGYDVEIIEAHHRHKVDAPSGTALRMGEVIAQTQGKNLEKVAIYGREGHTGERAADTIGFSTIRGGDIVGDHTALFAGIGERLEITHKASSRKTFATGALHAARFLATKKSGLFDMQDVLGLR
ncbi:4-hydroxy-tetrahydrodipicolinate reductase [Nitrosomonas eutropha]|uniref:4-hydroxy-tetrahydrodipicolinate reductase n=2 Tax=Nitrosomonas eutropha TaxID=916 RepID=DAPB_NITEC|nr:4-hydroxy-tetrahydrodipicolinate reductase [Nitrosomonas eutropha]Q0AER1.1 RecName: Full=4-hydroxy-tetrahydrodipicolinate reductase; Short=HTPA reductase [Nitrosomonas eutropha C91]ABI60171.1 dihydrodipicolinate reductase [Nitrosomonas eutropha C91]PXV77007.1 dihydrodipicolinate reductase [Nitrosomonas eutropha]SCX14811.1 dihydrodipicolinate reductase [Nitrosomonas eutropha]